MLSLQELGDVERAPTYNRDTSKTVAWFQKRQDEASRKLDEQQRSSQEEANLNGSSSADPAGNKRKVPTPPPAVTGQRKANEQRKASVAAAVLKNGKPLSTPTSTTLKKFDLFGFLKPKS